MKGLFRRLAEQALGQGDSAIRPLVRMLYVAPLELTQDVGIVSELDHPEPLRASARGVSHVSAELSQRATGSDRRQTLISEQQARPFTPSRSALQVGIVPSSGGPSEAGDAPLPGDVSLPSERIFRETMPPSGEPSAGGKKGRIVTQAGMAENMDGEATPIADGPSKFGVAHLKGDVSPRSEGLPREVVPPSRASPAGPKSGSVGKGRRNELVTPDRLAVPAALVGPVRPTLPQHTVGAPRRTLGPKKTDPVSESEPTEIHVHIGRIEVTAVQEGPTKKPKASPGPKPMSLDEYLARRKRGQA